MTGWHDGKERERERESESRGRRQYDVEEQKETQWHTNRAICSREEGVIEDDTQGERESIEVERGEEKQFSVRH